MLRNFERVVYDWLTGHGVSGAVAQGVYKWMMLVGIIVISLMILGVTKRIAGRIGLALSKRTKTTFDDVLYNDKFFSFASMIIPLVFFNVAINYLISDGLLKSNFWPIVVHLLYVLFFASLIFIMLGSVNAVYNEHFRENGKSITHIVQALKVILIIITAILLISIIANKSTALIIKGFGAMSAVLMLIFKDTILGFVGGIQLAFNKIVLIGDWIEMPSYGADGVVVDISLITVKVENWDKTIISIPTYNLVTNPVKNWRNASGSNTRRFVKSFTIDAYSVKYCDKQLIEKLSKLTNVNEYLVDNKYSLDDFQDKIADKSTVINNDGVTNLSLFRKYLANYLSNRNDIDKGSTILVRQRQATNYGIPIEIYAFTNTSSWLPYEDIQSSICDHVYASVSYFDLKLFQSPSGHDVVEITDVINR